MNVLQRLAKKTSWHSTAMTGHTATHPCVVATNSSPGCVERVGADEAAALRRALAELEAKHRITQPAGGTGGD